MKGHEMPAPTLDQIQAEVDAGHVRVRHHPHHPLSIYTYTETCTYAGAWNAVNRICRGLIVEQSTGRVVAWPFPKFFNWSEHANGAKGVGPVPTGPFEVFDKVDGSLGIVFFYAGKWQVATKGAFTSPAAQWAQEWLDRHDTSELIVTHTYLAEITFPGNRVVCAYDGPGTLTLLGSYDGIGREIPLETARHMWVRVPGTKLRAPVVASWRATSVEDVLTAARENRHVAARHLSLTGFDSEGWVLRFADGTRVKIKLADYLRLHKIKTYTNARTVWEALSSGADPAGLLTVVPDEFMPWIRRKAHDLRTRHVLWTTAARDVYARLSHLHGDRKAFALCVLGSPYKYALFRLLDGKEIESLAWKAVEPTAATDPEFYPTRNEGVAGENDRVQ
jgi:RNA ligase